MAQTKSISITEASHPHIFSAYPEFRRAAAQKGGTLKLSPYTFNDADQTARVLLAPKAKPAGTKTALAPLRESPKPPTASASHVPPVRAEDGLAFANSYFAAKRGTSGGAVNRKDRPQASAPTADFPAERIDAYFAMRREARAKHGR